MEDRPGDHHPLRHTARESEGVGLGPVGELESLEQFVGSLARGLRAHAEVAAVEVEVLEHGEAAVERVDLRDHADELLGERRLGDDVDVADEGLAARGDDPSRQHADGRGLAGTVGPEEAEDLAFADREVELIDGLHRRGAAPTRELLGQADAADHLGTGEGQRRGGAGVGGFWTHGHSLQTLRGRRP